MLERFLKQTSFKNMDDFCKNYKVIVPENFNLFGQTTRARNTSLPSPR